MDIKISPFIARTKNLRDFMEGKSTTIEKAPLDRGAVHFSDFEITGCIEVSSFLRDKTGQVCCVVFKSDELLEFTALFHGEEEIKCRTMKDKDRATPSYYYFFDIEGINSTSAQVYSRSGVVELQFRNDRGQNKYVSIVISPAVSHEDYDALLEDISEVSIDLLLDNTAGVKEQIKVFTESRVCGANHLSNELDIAKNLYGDMKVLDRALSALVKTPSSFLSKSYELTSVFKIKKFDGKVVLSMQSRGDGRALGIKYTESTNLKEHQIIKGYLLSLQKYVKALKSKVDRKLHTIDDTLKNIEDGHYENVGCSEDESVIIVLRDKQVELCQKKKIELREAFVIYAKISKIFDKWILDNFFSTIPAERKLEKTHLFSHHRTYKRVYNLMIKNYNLINIINMIDFEWLAIHKQSTIYEKWCFLKILHILNHEYGFSIEGDKRNIPKIIQSLLSRGGIEGRTIDLRKHITVVTGNTVWGCNIRKRLELELTLGYNCTLPGSYLRPDFYLKIGSESINKDRYYIFDSKYRRYKDMRMSPDKDVYGVCAEKYIYRLIQETGKDIRTAFILHSDKECPKHDLGCRKGNHLLKKVEEERRERYLQTPKETIQYFKGLKQEYENIDNRFGRVVFLPSNYQGFNEIIRMIMEYYEDGFLCDGSNCRDSEITPSMCWLCGSSNIEVQKREVYSTGRYKIYIRCAECGEFWVKNYCHVCREALYKHKSNYLPDKGWTFIHCQSKRCKQRREGTNGDSDWYDNILDSQCSHIGESEEQQHSDTNEDQQWSDTSDLKFTEIPF